MQFGDILVCMDDSATGRKRTELALALAARSRARVVGYYLAPRSGNPAEDFLDPSDATVREAAALEFDRLLRLWGVEGMWVPGNRQGTVDDIANYARCTDLVVAGLGYPDDTAADPRGLDIERLVVDCGRPVLGIPVAGVGNEIGQTVMVAWDGSRESARALHDAIPFLRDATTIKIVSIDGDPSSPVAPNNVVLHLKRLGIAAAIDTEVDTQLPTGDEILSRIEREEVDLLVAGAFGRSRLWERLFGGTSRTLIHQMMVPVLVSH